MKIFVFKLCFPNIHWFYWILQLGNGITGFQRNGTQMWCLFMRNSLSLDRDNWKYIKGISSSNFSSIYFHKSWAKATAQTALTRTLLRILLVKIGFPNFWSSRLAEESSRDIIKNIDSVALWWGLGRYILQISPGIGGFGTDYAKSHIVSSMKTVKRKFISPYNTGKVILIQSICYALVTYKSYLLLFFPFWFGLLGRLEAILTPLSFCIGFSRIHFCI